MSTTGSLIVFIIIWWIVFFSVLPLGIKSETKKFTEKVSGNDPGAPKNPNIGKKFIYTTVITSIIFVGIFMLVKYDYLNLRRFIS